MLEFNAVYARPANHGACVAQLKIPTLPISGLQSAARRHDRFATAHTCTRIIKTWHSLIDMPNRVIYPYSTISSTDMRCPTNQSVSHCSKNDNNVDGCLLLNVATQFLLFCDSTLHFSPYSYCASRHLFLPDSALASALLPRLDIDLTDYTLPLFIPLLVAPVTVQGIAEPVLQS
jgi:hypothetical protein